MLTKSFDVRVVDQVVKCKSYTLRDLVKISLTKTASDSEPLKKIYSEILSKCVLSDTKFNKHESELLLIHLIAQSESEDCPKLEYTCECGKTKKVNLNLNHISIDNLDTPLILKLKNFSIKFKWPDLWADDDIASMIAKSIEAIYVGDERIELDDLTDTELNDLYSAITDEHIDYINKMLTAPVPVLGVPVKCECGKTSVEKLIGFKAFMDVI